MIKALLLEGDSEVIDGVGLPVALMVKAALPEVPPPGLDTVTWAVPAVAMSPGPMPVVTCVALTYVVGRLAPFQFTTDPLTNPLPFTVRRKPQLPAVAEAGSSEVIDGVGLPVAFMVKAALPAPPPPGLGA